MSVSAAGMDSLRCSYESTSISGEAAPLDPVSLAAQKALVQVEILLPGTTIRCLKIKLKQASPVFKKMLSKKLSMRESCENSIDFNPQISSKGLSASSVRLFFEWINGKKPSMVPTDNILEVLDLAYRYQIVEIEEQCVEELIGARGLLSIQDIYHIYCFARARGLSKLQNYYFAYLYNSQETHLDEQLDQKIKEWKGKGILIKDSDPKISFTTYKDIDSCLIQSLEEYNGRTDFLFPLLKGLPDVDFREFVALAKKFHSLSCVHVKKINDRQLEYLLKELPKLDSLVIESSLLTRIVAPNLKNLSVTGWNNATNLLSIEARKAEKIQCSGQSYLSRVVSDAVKELDCSNCPCLKTLYAHQVIRLNCSGCRKLQVVDAPVAEEANYSNCSALERVHTPQAIKIECSHSPKVAEVFAPKVREISLRQAHILTELCFLQAEQAFFNTCDNLTTVVLPEATEVQFFNCKNLTTIVAPKAKVLKYNSCPRLQLVNGKKP